MYRNPFGSAAKFARMDLLFKLYLVYGLSLHKSFASAPEALIVFLDPYDFQNQTRYNVNMSLDFRKNAWRYCASFCYRSQPFHCKICMDQWGSDRLDFHLSFVPVKFRSTFIVLVQWNVVANYAC